MPPLDHTPARHASFRPAGGPARPFAGLACDGVIEHLHAMGVTAIELMPVHAFVNDRHLVEKRLTNWLDWQRPIRICAGCWPA